MLQRDPEDCFQNAGSLATWWKPLINPARAMEAEPHVLLHTIFLNGCNTLQSLAEHRNGALKLLVHHPNLLLLGSTQEVDWAKGSATTKIILNKILLLSPVNCCHAHVFSQLCTYS